MGLSPRVRGNPLIGNLLRLRDRSIPACAGEPSPDPDVEEQGDGLSPRVRGNPVTDRERMAPRGSIPACAGEPPSSHRSGTGGTVYPRVCGGTVVDSRHCPSSEGLSPRVRGNPTAMPSAAQLPRSIPACAGEPAAVNSRPTTAAVYPRVCGGTLDLVRWIADAQGLSPRVRGNRRPPPRTTRTPRSIPACAGEPFPALPERQMIQVYPRVCGGTNCRMMSTMGSIGLSPRVRGNPASASSSLSSSGSIPACAGEPIENQDYTWRMAVYPRVCGGTELCLTATTSPVGLSPRVRGNLDDRVRSRLRGGSIPACAGEPVSYWPLPAEVPVYPRVCGGTPPGPSVHQAAEGLSPRVRGNPAFTSPFARGTGSIPACAGEPNRGCRPTRR